MAGKKKSIFDYEGFGIKGNALNPFDWGKVIIAGVVLIFGAIFAQNTVKRVGQKVPVDSSLDPIFTQAQAVKTNQKQYV